MGRQGVGWGNLGAAIRKESHNGGLLLSTPCREAGWAGAAQENLLSSLGGSDHRGLGCTSNMERAT